MANFVLAGKSDCPHYAKAELLADSLQRNLPNFRLHKISILPHEWTEWLETTCKKNNWKHKTSPLIWRDLVDQGGRRMLLGGFSDFLDYCQDYYGVTSDMSTDMMLSVAAENLEAKMNLTEEERYYSSLIKPLHIWISSALSPTCSFLIPSLVSADVFPHAAAVSLHLLHLDGGEEELQELRMETEDLALPLLHQVNVHTDLEKAFEKADVIIFLDECCLNGGDTKNDNDKKKEKRLKQMSERYREYGQLIDTRANREVKVIVSGDSFANRRCSLLVDNVHSINCDQFVTIATQLEDEARAIIAKKLKVQTTDVTDVIIWGNISGRFHIDLQRTKVFNYDGPIKGPPFFSQSLLKIFYDRKWLATDLQHLVRCQRAAVVSKTCRAAAMSAANGILSILKTWTGSCDPGQVWSLGVVCPGYYDLPDDIVFSVPVSFSDGKWSLSFDVTVGDELKETLQISARELKKEKDLGSDDDDDDDEGRQLITQSENAD